MMKILIGILMMGACVAQDTRTEDMFQSVVTGTDAGPATLDPLDPDTNLTCTNVEGTEVCCWKEPGRTCCKWNGRERCVNDSTTSPTNPPKAP